MPTRPGPDLLTRTLRGRQVSRVLDCDEQRLSIHFTDGATLTVEAGTHGLRATLEAPKKPSGYHDIEGQPTKRQLEYLDFIEKYILHFARAPAESDIARHCLVSAPTVNQMVRTLERRGFITRQKGVPRSIQIRIELCGARNG
jgi:hypothetical protein